ncbi:radical SAM protein [Streptomyces diastatochromogenes]|uniref:radical SAM protein n=1 Tax=Streptomyces diastatochromogenes TaxID=42236 RepID=UPI0036B0093E
MGGQVCVEPVREEESVWLDFLWLELTNRCNLQCVHCYTDSHPQSGHRDLLSKDHYDKVMTDAYALGCRRVQLIGGEPQLSPHFGHLLARAKHIGYEFVEVFSNLTHLSDETLDFAAEHDVAFATSVYSHDPAVHDRVTKVRSSHERTVRNLRRIVERGVTVRAAVIAIDQGQDDIDRTKDFLHGMGVDSVRVGDIREFGRAQDVMAQNAQLSGLCGHCWRGRLCVSPDGTAYACVMAREWPVGNVLEEELAQILRGVPLDRMRQTIREEVWVPRAQSHADRSKTCEPSEPHEPTPYCSPDVGPCGPGDCPQGGDEPTPRCVPDGCPQSCEPDTCPQSCDPNPFCTPDVEE